MVEEKVLNENISSREAKYPEHEKLMKVREPSQTIGEFIEWLRNNKGIVFAKWGEDEIENMELLVPDHVSTEKILAEYYGIDLDKLEQEKRAMLEELRKANGTTN